MRMTATIAMLLCAGSIGLAQTTRPKLDSQTRVYDVRDLLIRVRDFPFTGTMGVPEESPAVVAKPEGDGSLFGGRKAASKPKERTYEELVEEVIRLIRETVAPESWREAGGKEGSIREVGGALVITQTPENQQLIESIFEQLREGGERIRVQAHWVVLRPEQLSSIVGPAEQKGDVSTIDMAALANLKEGQFRGEIACMNGQQVSISSGRTRTVIYDQEAVVAQNAVAMSPRVKQVREGAMLEVTPIVVGDSAVVEVRSQVAQWDEPTSVTQSFSASTTRPGDRAITGQADSVVIDRLNVASQELRATLRIPLNQPVLVGGMTVEPATDEAESPQLYLILTVSRSG